ncbi:MAG: patatin-like phospholipase family protein [Parcubacteria group bacterium]|nr:patatin-like phospholipase family protein [Parcubacteria group bacterium]
MEDTKKSAFVSRLKEKRALLAAGDPRHEKIRTLLMISGGGMRGPYGAGVALALHHLELADCFDTVIGISTGAAIGGYFLTGKEQAALGTTIYYEECLHGFISPSFPLPKLRIEFLEDVFRNGKKRIDLLALRRHRSHFFVGVTHWDTGTGSLVNVKLARPDAVAAITASLALTYAYPTPVMVNGQKSTDGGISEPLPVKKAVEWFQPTDVLIISNYSREESSRMGHTVMEFVFDALAKSRIPASLVPAFNVRDKTWQENISYAKNLTGNTAILYGAKEVGVLTQDLAKLRGATLKGIADTLALFEDAASPHVLMP